MPAMGIALNTYFVASQGDTPTVAKGEPVYKWVFDANVVSGIFETVADWFAKS